MAVGRSQKGTARNRLGAVLRRAKGRASFPEIPGESRRPTIFSLLFWVSLVMALLTWAFDLFGEEGNFGILPVSLATAALVVVWLALPWDPRASGRRKLLVPVFLVAGFVVGQMTTQTMNFLWILAFYPIAVANGVFLFGFSRGVAYAACALPLMGASFYLTYPQKNAGLAGMAFFFGITAAVGVFVIGLCKSLIDAVRSRQEAQALLGELERQTGRVKELAISEERARLAREVHDSVGHHLTAINLQLQNAERFGGRDPERSRRKVREARESTLAALAEVRRSVRALKPPALQERSGVAAIRTLARSFDGTGLEVSFELEGEELTLPEEAELALYRATQEGLTNAAKHSGARVVCVVLALEPGEAKLSVADDGDGAPEGMLEGGFGLSALSERVEALGGTLLAAGNRTEGGFALEVTLPTTLSRGPEGG